MIHPPNRRPPQAFFLAMAHGGERFCLFHPPQVEKHLGRVLFLHPFAEELNTTRRVVAQQARALAQAGFAVLQIDLLGCGDSSGDFADATWQAWLADAQQAHAWLGAHTSGPLWLWGMRAGALLASDLAHSLTEPANLLFWQPAASGQQMLQQFLRMQAASQWLGSGNSAESSPTQVLSLGERVNIAGYTLTPALAQGLAAATLQPPADQPPGQLMWLEVSSQADPRLSAWAEKQAGRWQTAGWRVRAHAVSAPPFWQTVGTENAPALINATLTALTLGTAPLAAQVVATENKAL